MGKKSKQKRNAAKAKSGASGAVAPAAASELGIAGGSGGSGGIGKKARCVSCLALVKEASKGHACPGCSELYCWRCEKKQFFECPNGKLCVLPLKRCHGCISGFTKNKELRAIGEQPVELDDGREHFSFTPGTRHRILFDDIIKKRDDLTMESFPFVRCGSVGCCADDETAVECIRCVQAPVAKRLSCCSVCGILRCGECVNSLKEPMTRAAHQLNSGMLLKGNPEISVEDLVAFRNKLVAYPDGMITCKTCIRETCVHCLDLSEMKRLAELLTVKATEAGFERRYDDYVSNSHFQCSGCYWSAKPCTNPTCPNDVGIPTKRCGRCHLDRYCSVECQAAAYPDHIGRCQKIQAKRAAEAGKEGSEE